MNIEYLSNLITIRQYVKSSIEYPSIDKKNISMLNKTADLLDKKIVGLVLSEEFQELIRPIVEDKSSLTSLT